MNCKEAYRKLGGSVKAGINRAETIADTVSSTYKVHVEIVPHENEEEPEDNWLNVLIEYRAGGQLDQTEACCRAIDDLIRRFEDRGLSLEHECSGDGNGIIESFRVNRRLT